MGAGASLSIRRPLGSDEDAVIKKMPLEEEEDSVGVPPVWWFTSGQATELDGQKAAAEIWQQEQEEYTKKVRFSVSPIPAVMEDCQVELPEVGDEDKDNLNNNELENLEISREGRQQEISNNEAIDDSKLDAANMLIVEEAISVTEPNASKMSSENLEKSISSQNFNVTDIAVEQEASEVCTRVASAVESSEMTGVKDTVVTADTSETFAVEDFHNVQDQASERAAKSDVSEMLPVPEHSFKPDAPDVLSEVVKSVVSHMLHLTGSICEPYPSGIICKSEDDIKVEAPSNAGTIIAVKPGAAEMLILDKESSVEPGASSTHSEDSYVKALGVYMSTGLLGVGSIVMKWRQEIVDAENAELELKAKAEEPSPPTPENPKSNTADFKAWCATKKRSLSRCLRRTGGRISRRFKMK